ncbi:SDR family NAD(P)-dependent oxidoreductase [Sphingobium yanoikuyae]|uniref:SDR family NAD(P)-dependent oxidoreductase n=1 Tax=Sphingobium yanoikuyae TaxID=13690 RepID=UPI00345E5B7E
MDLGLSGKKVVVSGGSRGIGRAIVELFVAEGAQVAFCARGAGGVVSAQQELGDNAFGTAVDVTNAVEVQQLRSGNSQPWGNITPRRLPSRHH